MNVNIAAPRQTPKQEYEERAAIILKSMANNAGVPEKLSERFLAPLHDFPVGLHEESYFCRRHRWLR